jgi:DNA helicase HerA-like ATPase
MDDVHTGSDQLRTLARSLRASVSRVPALAWSTDGTTFDFEAPLVHPIDIGGFVTIVDDDGRRWFGSVVAKDVVVRSAPAVHLDLDPAVSEGIEGAHIGSADVQLTAKVVQGTGKLLGRLEADDTCVPTRREDRFLDADIAAADPDLVARLLARDDESGLLDVGQVTGVPARVLLRAAGFNRHSFLCGQSGSGKTFAFGVLLERLLADTDLRLVVLDPNGDYVRLGTPRSEADVVGPPVLPGRTPVAELLARYGQRCRDVTVLRPRAVLDGAHDDAQPLVVQLGDLDVDALGRVFGIDPVADTDAYSALVRLHDTGMADGVFSMDEARDLALGDDRADMAALVQRVSNFGIGRWGVWARDGERSVIDVLRSDARVVVVDLSGFGNRREAATVSLAVLDHLWNSRDERRATLVAIDEAHNVCPATSDDPLRMAASDQVDRIAAEGRKFGLHLLLSTQRPTKVPVNALSQCENLVLMRMNSTSDIAALAETFSFVPRSLLDQARRFGQGETLLAGGIVGEPTLARFDRRLSEEPGSDVPTTWAIAAADRR